MTVTSSQGFVQQLYQSILFRSGSAADVSAWANAIDGGSMTEAQATAAFVGSAEATNDVLPIIRLYQVFLDRAPDQAGW